MAARLGEAPLLVLNDRLPGFLTVHKNVFKTDPSSTLYIADAALNGVHLNNNNNSVHECHNGSVAQFIVRARGSRSDESGFCTLHNISQLFTNTLGTEQHDVCRKIWYQDTGPQQAAHIDAVSRGIHVQILLMRYLAQD